METSQKLALTVPQAATALGFAEATVWKYIANGTLPSFKLGKSRRIPVDALQEWIRAQAEQATANEQGATAA
jgi:excisionase family DNA binding protein